MQLIANRAYSTPTLPFPIPGKPFKRMAASKKECLIGRNRKARKVFCNSLLVDGACFGGKYAKGVRITQTVDPIYYKRIRREARHMENSWSLY